jgi:hypothetical protein
MSTIVDIMGYIMDIIGNIIGNIIGKSGDFTEYD